MNQSRSSSSSPMPAAAIFIKLMYKFKLSKGGYYNIHSTKQLICVHKFLFLFRTLRQHLVNKWCELSPLLEDKSFALKIGCTRETRLNMNYEYLEKGRSNDKYT